MKVLIVYPRRDPSSPVRTQFDMRKHFELFGWPTSYRGYGLYLNVLDTLASATPPGIEVRTVNEHLEDIDFDEKVDLVALSCMITTASRGYEIADEFRRRGVQVIMGGYHPFVAEKLNFHDEVLSHVDSICVSEGDDIWGGILEDARNGRLKRLYRQEHQTDMGATSHRVLTSRWHWLRHVYMTVQVSRGCPFHCNFCSIIAMLGNNMRYKTPEAVVAELEPIYRRDIIGRVVGRPIFLVDDNIYGHPKSFKAILRAIIDLNRRYPRFKPAFGSQLTINVTRDREALELLAEANFHIVFIGLESLDRKILLSYEKHHNVAFDYDEAVSKLREYGIETVASFIFGQDGETEAVFDQAFEFFQRNNVVYPYFNILTPGASQWEQFHAEGRILTKEWRLYDAQHTVFIPMNMRPQELQRRFVDLVTRVFDYENIKKRMVGAYVEGRSRQIMPPYPVQVYFYFKTLAALAAKGDSEGYRFLKEMGPYVLKRRISIFYLIFQIDQHDFAVQNRHTLREHPYELDVPSWEERKSMGLAGTLLERHAEAPGLLGSSA